MYCSNCGNPVAANAAACLKCGVNPRTEKKFCPHCGETTNPNQVVCIKCGGTLAQVGQVAAQGGKKRMTAVLLAFIFGWVGAHKFYYGSWGWGIVYIILNIMTSGIFVLVSTIEAFYLWLKMDDAKFNQKYNETPATPFKW